MIYRLSDSERLAVLSAFVLDTLDEMFEESQLDDDSNPPQTVLYNVASACRDLRASPVSGYDRAEYADRELTSVIESAVEGSAVYGVNLTLEVHR